MTNDLNKTLDYLRLLETTPKEDFNIPAPAGWDPQKLNAMGREILRLRVALPSAPIAEIAEAVGCHPQTVNLILGSTLGRVHLAFLNEQLDEDALDVAEAIQQFAPVALALRHRMAVDPDTPAAVRERILDKELDRAGFGAVSKNLNINANAKLARVVADAQQHLSREGIVINSEDDEFDDDNRGRSEV